MDRDAGELLRKLMRQVLGATTDGERLAALAALERVMAAQGLDLHDIAARIGDGMAPAAAEDAGGFGGELLWEAAERMVAEHDDDLWPGLAGWLVVNDDDWQHAHRRWLLTGKQRQFAEEMREAATIIRPTSRQCAYLLFLFMRVSDQLDRPAPTAPAPIAPVGSAAAAAAGDKPQRVMPPRRPKPVPQRVASRPMQVHWIVAVVEARRLGPRPAADAAQTALFSDAELRVLTWFAARYQQWLIDRPERDSLRVGHRFSAVEMAAKAQVSLRTVRRAVAKAVAAGYLAVETPGGGRGQKAVYDLTWPEQRRRHADLPAQQPRRQRRAG